MLSGASLNRLGFVKPTTLINWVNWLGLPAIGLYVFCMFIFPWCDSRGSWASVQEVWDRWQGLNVGMLAFLSSLVAFNISSYNAFKQREREFQAAKAFLPSALSGLCGYFDESARFLNQAWDAAEGNNRPRLTPPALPDDYKQVFSECIKHATPDVGDFLSKILVWLQVHDTRMKEFSRQFADRGYVNPNRHNLITYFYRLAQLRALVNKIFDFARGMEEFDRNPLKWEDFRNALRNMDVWYENIVIDEQMALEPFIRRAIERGDA